MPAQSPSQFGQAGDIPLSGDFDGDGAPDIAMYQPSTGHWFVQGQPNRQLGGPGDIPVPADYNGDGITDIAVFRPSAPSVQWFHLRRRRRPFLGRARRCARAGRLRRRRPGRSRGLPSGNGHMVDPAVIHWSDGDGSVRADRRHPARRRFRRGPQNRFGGVSSVDRRLVHHAVHGRHLLASVRPARRYSRPARRRPATDGRSCVSGARRPEPGMPSTARSRRPPASSSGCPATCRSWRVRNSSALDRLTSTAIAGPTSRSTVRRPVTGSRASRQRVTAPLRTCSGDCRVTSPCPATTTAIGVPTPPSTAPRPANGSFAVSMARY